jgi:hypothetical protein
MSDATVGFYWVPSGDTLQEQLNLLRFTGATAVIVPYRLLDTTLVEALQKQNIKIFADWTVFAGDELRQAFPDSVPVEASGAPFEREDWYIPACPNHPLLRQRHLVEMERLFERWAHALDGLWLDFIRYPVRWEVEQPYLRQLCFCRHCLNLFLQRQQAQYSPEETRELAQLILATRFEEWVSWKCMRIVQFVQEVRAQLASQAHPIRLGMFSLPWRRKDFDGAIRTVAAQDLGQLAQVVDVISPMVYHKLCYQPVAWIADVVQDVYDWTQRPVLPVIQSLDQPAPLLADEMNAALKHALNVPAIGTIIFTLEPVLASTEKAHVVQTRFTRV